MQPPVNPTHVSGKQDTVPGLAGSKIYVSEILQHNFLPCLAFVLCLKEENKGLFLPHGTV